MAVCSFFLKCANINVHCLQWHGVLLAKIWVYLWLSRALKTSCRAYQVVCFEVGYCRGCKSTATPEDLLEPGEHMARPPIHSSIPYPGPQRLSGPLVGIKITVQSEQGLENPLSLWNSNDTCMMCTVLQCWNIMGYWRCHWNSRQWKKQCEKQLTKWMMSISSVCSRNGPKGSKNAPRGLFWPSDKRHIWS